LIIDTASSRLTTFPAMPANVPLTTLTRSPGKKWADILSFIVFIPLAKETKMGDVDCMPNRSSKKLDANQLAKAIVELQRCCPCSAPKTPRRGELTSCGLA
jgi:hypothetical protein